MKTNNLPMDSLAIMQCLIILYLFLTTLTVTGAAFLPSTTTASFHHWELFDVPPPATNNHNHRRLFLLSSLALPPIAWAVDKENAGLLSLTAATKPANPFVQLETVGMVPKSYFVEHRSIYAFTERILDGDTIRVRHVPGFALTNNIPEPLSKRGIADETLLVRLYGIDCPELAKNKNQTTQPFGEEAKQYTNDAIYHKMVKVTFLRKDRYGRAIAMVETLPEAGFLLSGIPGLGPKDLSLELAKAGLAELYSGGGAEYYTKKDDLKAAIREAQLQKRGIWSLGDAFVSAAEQKRILRSEQEDPAATFAQ